MLCRNLTNLTRHFDVKLVLLRLHQLILDCKFLSLLHFILRLAEPAIRNTAKELLIAIQFVPLLDMLAILDLLFHGVQKISDARIGDDFWHDSVKLKHKVCQSFSVTKKRLQHLLCGNTFVEHVLQVVPSILTNSRFDAVVIQVHILLLHNLCLLHFLFSLIKSL